MRFPLPRHRRGLIGRVVTVAVGVTAVSAFLAPAGSAAAPGGSGAARLAGVATAVDRSGVQGIAWYTDAKAGQVVVTADRGVSAAQLAAIQRAAGGGAALRIQRSSGLFTPLLAAGDAIYGARYRCSLGFNVVSGSTYYLLTAGHCGVLEKTWYANSAGTAVIGPTVGASFPGNDYALVRYDNTSLAHPGGYTVADAFVGEQVTRRGSTTGVHSGTVTGLNASVRYRGHPGGTVTGLIQTTVCAEGGDSGGPLYDGSKALGLTSGGSGDCTTGGTTFFQPVREAAQAYNVTIY